MNLVRFDSPVIEKTETSRQWFFDLLMRSLLLADLEEGTQFLQRLAQIRVKPHFLLSF